VDIVDVVDCGCGSCGCGVCMWIVDVDNLVDTLWIVDEDLWIMDLVDLDWKGIVDVGVADCGY